MYSPTHGHYEVYVGDSERPRIDFSAPDGVEYTFSRPIDCETDGGPASFIADWVTRENQFYYHTYDIIDAAVADGALCEVATWGENMISVAWGPLQSSIAYCAESNIEGARVIGFGRRKDDGEIAIFLHVLTKPGRAAEFRESPNAFDFTNALSFIDGSKSWV